MNIVITGASKGIGKAIAHAFAATGANLYCCARGAVNLYKMVEELQVYYPNANINAMPADVSSANGAKEFASWVIQKAGNVDVLVNNAGQFTPGTIQAEEDGVLTDLLNANLFSAYHVTRALLPTMVEAQRGHIFNICSIASVKAYSNGGSYSIAKHALKGFNDNLREEMKSQNIKVTGVYPGAVLTDSWAGFDNSSKRIMEASDIAKMIVAATTLSAQAVVEEIVLRPQLGDL
ncbi:MAG: SDR family oxidoreductase [Ferruginibacter sp.]